MRRGSSRSENMENRFLKCPLSPSTKLAQSLGLVWGALACHICCPTYFFSSWYWAWVASKKRCGCSKSGVVFSFFKKVVSSSMSYFTLVRLVNQLACMRGAPFFFTCAVSMSSCLLCTLWTRLLLTLTTHQLLYLSIVSFWCYTSASL